MTHPTSKVARLYLFAALATATATASFAQSPGMFADPLAREQAVQRLDAENTVLLQEALTAARAKGAQTEGINSEGSEFRITGMILGAPLYTKTFNSNAAISTGANLVRNTAPYSVNGTGIVVGIWDGGSIRATHQELTGRITNNNAVGLSNHSTHVAGTIMGSGAHSPALGMAPAATVQGYDFNNDEAEMAARAAAVANQADKVMISNHSYGTISGWDFGTFDGTNTGPYWFGVLGQRESIVFGMYDSQAVSWDTIVYNAPYYLPVKSAGNDRNDDAPGNGTTFYTYNFADGTFSSKAYDSSTDPFNDGFDNGGFDTISTTGTAKNILTVGAVNDAQVAGVRNPAAGTMSDFSGWGPTDDGRIKPDVVGNGVSLTSSYAGSDSQYASSSGTSMSAPNVTGTAVLLMDLYNNHFPSSAMMASTLKALLIHTATDVGNTGPDYSYGWGLVDCKTAADLINLHAANVNTQVINEGELTSSRATTATYNVVWDGSSPLRATLVWTDPPGPENVETLDATALRLVNNLNLKIVGPGNQEFLPFVLDPSNPANNATTGVNTRDNVEQVLIANPPQAGNYSVQVSFSGNLTNGAQDFSLIISGQQTSSVTPTATPVPTPSPTPPPNPRECDDGSFLSQGPNATSAYTSDLGTDFECFEGFFDVTEPICRVTWWGAHATQSAATCAETVNFVITIRADNAGSVGAVTAGPFIVTPTKTSTSATIIGIPLFRFDADIPCTTQTNGHISIQAQAGSDSNCFFFWETSSMTADGDGKFTQSNGGALSEFGTDLALCLSSGDAAYDPTDTDGDGFTDQIEDQFGGDANDPNVHPDFGDFSGDSSTTFQDAIWIYRALLNGGVTFDEKLDIDLNGSIGINDAHFLWQWSTGNPDFPVIPRPAA